MARLAVFSSRKAVAHQSAGCLKIKNTFQSGHTVIINNAMVVVRSRNRLARRELVSIFTKNACVIFSAVLPLLAGLARLARRALAYPMQRVRIRLDAGEAGVAVLIHRAARSFSEGRQAHFFSRRRKCEAARERHSFFCRKFFAVRNKEAFLRIFELFVNNKVAGGEKAV